MDVGVITLVRPSHTAGRCEVGSLIIGMLVSSVRRFSLYDPQSNAKTFQVVVTIPTVGQPSPGVIEDTVISRSRNDANFFPLELHRLKLHRSR
jgi:hypothetical protein